MNIADIKVATEVVRAGGVIAYPTESCYGLGCDPRRHYAVQRLLIMKRRHWQHGLILIAARVQQLKKYIDFDQQHALQRAIAVWPGPYTWLMPCRPQVSKWIKGQHRTIAVRVTAHRGAAALCNHARLALISTSANRHGRPPARSAKAVRREFGDDVDYVLVGNLGKQKRQSQIRDAATNQIVRHG